jgi:hypothetical protein
VNKEVRQKHENGLYEKILEWTGTGEWRSVNKLRFVTGSELSIDKF